jgi:predicted F0F1-ATPase subunit
MRKRNIDTDQGLNNKFEVLLSGTTRIKNQKVKEQKARKAQNSTMYYLGLVSELGFAISIPIVLCALLGRYLDGLWGFYPKMTLSLIVVGCIVSIINFIEVIKTIIKKSKD